MGEGRVSTAERVRRGMGAGTLIEEGDRPMHHALPFSYPPSDPMASLPWLILPWHEVGEGEGGQERASLGIRGGEGTWIGSWYNREHDCHVYVCIMWMIMHVTCMCRRMHAMHVHRCMWVY